MLVTIITAVSFLSTTGMSIQSFRICLMSLAAHMLLKSLRLFLCYLCVKAYNYTTEELAWLHGASNEIHHTMQIEIDQGLEDELKHDHLV